MNKMLNKYLSWILIAFIVFIWTLDNYNLANNKNYKLIFFDLHLWESTLIKTPKNKNIIIDWGYWDDLLPKLSKHLWFFENTIDLIVLTHPQADHLWWLIWVISKFKIWEIWLIKNDYNSEQYNQFLKIILEKNIRYKFINEKSDMIFEKDLIIDSLYPLSNWEWKSYIEKNINDGSIVLKISIWKNKKQILFTWDISKNIEKILIKNVSKLKSDILKVAHHGSKSSSDENFLKIVNPDIALIWASQQNKFGHPHKQVLEIYEKLKIKTLVTWKMWDIILEF